MDKLKDFKESILFEVVSVKPDKMRSRIAIIKAGKSKNDRNYSAEVLKSAVNLFDGAKIFLDHTDIKGGRDGNRSVTELSGFIENPEWVESKKRIEADAQFINTEAGRFGNELVKVIAETKRSDLAGLSINGRGKVTFDNDGVENVEELNKIISVDIVSEPAAGGEFLNIYESVNKKTEERKMDFEKLTLEDLKKNRADLIQKLSEEVESRVYGDKNALDSQFKEMKTMIEAQSNKIKELIEWGAVKETEAQLEKALVASELPEVAQKRIRKMFEARIAKPEEITTVIADEKAYLAEITKKEMVGVGNSVKEDGKVDKDKYEKITEDIMSKMGFPVEKKEGEK